MIGRPDNAGADALLLRRETEDRMPRSQPRKRRRISGRRARLLPWLGFRYSIGRQAYVLRVVGDSFGPVYQLRSEPSATSATEPEPTPPNDDVRAVYGGPQHPRPTRSPQEGLRESANAQADSTERIDRSSQR